MKFTPEMITIQIEYPLGCKVKVEAVEDDFTFVGHVIGYDKERIIVEDDNIIAVYHCWQSQLSHLD